MRELKIQLDEGNTEAIRILSVRSGNSSAAIVNQLVRDKLRDTDLESLRIEKRELKIILDIEDENGN